MISHDSMRITQRIYWDTHFSIGKYRIQPPQYVGSRVLVMLPIGAAITNVCKTSCV